MADVTDPFRAAARLAKTAALKTEVVSAWWGTVASVSGAEVTVVLDGDDLLQVQPVTANAGGPCLVGDEMLLQMQGRDLTIVANPTAQARLAAQVATLTADTGWVASGVATVNAGVTISSQTFRRVGRVVSFDLLLVATVATTVPTSGDIGNSIYVVNLASGWYPTTGPTQGVGSNGASGRVLSGGVTTSGQMHVGAVGGAGTIAVGDPLRLAGTYIV